MVPAAKKRLKVYLLLTAFMLLGLTFVLDRIDQKDHYKAEPFLPKSAQDFNAFSMNRSALRTFISEHFTSEGLITYNLKDYSQQDEPSGKDILSESVGLILLYDVETDQHKAFAEHFKLAKSKLQKENGLFKWRMRAEQTSEENRAGADLKIAKALMIASEKWHDPVWRAEARLISAGLIENCVKDGQLLNSDIKKAPNAQLFELDMSAMLMLAEFDPEWKTIASDSLKTIQKSRFPYNPFYLPSEADHKVYLTSENLQVILNLAQTGQNNLNDLRWLKLQLKRGPVYESYNALGKPLSQQEQAANYGMIAQIGKYTNDQELYTLACDHLVDMQNKGFSDYSGGYTDPKTGDGTAFDQLMALLGY